MADTPETETGNTEYLRDWALNSLSADFSVSDEALRADAALLAAAEADYNAIHGVNAWARKVAETRQDLQEDADSFFDFFGNGDEALENFDPAQLLVEWVREDYPREQARIEAEAATLTEFPQDLQDLMATGSSEELMAAAMHYSVYASRGAIALQSLEDGQMTAEGVARINTDVEMYQNFSDRLWRQGVTRMDASENIKHLLSQNNTAHLVMSAERLAEEDGTLTTDQVRDLGVMSAVYSRLEGAAASGYAENLTDRIAQQLMPPEGERTESQEALLAQVREMETFISTMPDDPEELISAAQDYDSRAQTAAFYNETAAGFGYDGSIFTQASRPTEADLAQTESFQQASRILFEKETGQTWEEAGGENGYDAETIGDWGINYMSEQQNQFWEVLQQAGDIKVFSDYSPEEMNEMMAFLYASQTFETTRNDWGTFGRAAKFMLTDETNIASVALAVGSGGTSLLAQQGIKRAGQQAAMGVIREAVENGVQVGVRETAEAAAREAAERSVLTGIAATTRRFAAVEGSFGAIDGALQFNNDYLRQTDTGQTEFNWGTYTFGVGTSAAAGAAADYAIGRGLGFAIEGLANGATKALNFGPTRARAAELDATQTATTVTPEAATTAPRVEVTQAPAQPIITDTAEAVDATQTLAPLTPVETAPAPTSTLAEPDATPRVAPATPEAAPRVETAEIPAQPAAPTVTEAAAPETPAPVQPAPEIVTPDATSAPIAPQTPEIIRSAADIQAEQMAAQRARQEELATQDQAVAAQEQPPQQQQGNAGDDTPPDTTPPAQPQAPAYRGAQAHTYTPDQADIFTPQRLARISDENFGRIQPNTLKAFTPDQRAALNETQQGIFTNRIAPTLQPQDVANLDTAFIRNLRPEHIENLDADVMIEIAQNAQLNGAFRTETAQAFVPRLESIQAVRRSTQGSAPAQPTRDAAPEADTTPPPPPRADGNGETTPEAGSTQTEAAPDDQPENITLNSDPAAPASSPDGTYYATLSRVDLAGEPLKKKLAAPNSIKLSEAHNFTSTILNDMSPRKFGNIPPHVLHAMKENGQFEGLNPSLASRADKVINAHTKSLLKHPDRILLTETDMLTTEHMNTLSVKRINMVAPHVLKFMRDTGKLEGLTTELAARADKSIAYLNRGDYQGLDPKDNMEGYIKGFYNTGGDVPKWQQLFAYAKERDAANGLDTNPYNALSLGGTRNNSLTRKTIRPFLNAKDTIDAKVKSGMSVTDAQNETAQKLMSTLSEAVKQGFSQEKALGLIIYARVAGLRVPLQGLLPQRQGGSIPFNFDKDFYDRVLWPTIHMRPGTIRREDDQALLNYRKILNLSDEEMNWGIVPGRIASLFDSQRGFNPYRQVMGLRWAGDMAGATVKADGSYGFDWKSPFRAANVLLGRIPSGNLIRHADQGYYSNPFLGGLKYPLKAAGVALWLTTMYAAEEGVEYLVGDDITVMGEHLDITRNTIQLPAYLADVTLGNAYAGLVDDNKEMSFSGPGYVTAEWANAFGDGDSSQIGTTTPKSTAPYNPYRSDVDVGGESVVVAKNSTAPDAPAAPAATTEQTTGTPSAPDSTGTSDADADTVVAGAGNGTPPSSGNGTPAGVTGGGSASPDAPTQSVADRDFKSYLPVTLQKLFSRNNQEELGQMTNQAGGFLGGMVTGAMGIFRNLSTMLGPTWGPIAGIAALLAGGAFALNFMKNAGNFLTGGGLMKLGGAAALGVAGLYAFEHFSGAREQFNNEQGHDARLRNSGPITTPAPNREVGRTTLQRDHDFTYQGAIERMDEEANAAPSMHDTFAGQGSGENLPRDIGLLGDQPAQQTAALDGLTVTGDFRGISHDGGAPHTYMLTTDATGTAGIINASDMALIGGAQSAEYEYTATGAQMGLGFNGAQIAGGTYAATGNTHLPADFAALINDPAATRFDRTGHDKDQAIAASGWDSDVYTPAPIERQVAQNNPLTFNELTA